MASSRPIYPFRHYVFLVWALAWKNIRIKYKNSLLGFFWSLLNPLIFLLIFSFIFGQAFQGVENYKLFALSGLVAWSLFPVATNQVIGSLLENAGVLKSLQIPSLVFPGAAMVSSLINFLLTLIPFSVLMLTFGWVPGVETLALLPVLLLFVLFITGFSLFLCALNIYYRDVGLLWNTFTPAIFYFTPIAYPVQLVPEHIRWVMKLNPVYHFVESFRQVIYAGVFPPAREWLYMFILAAGAWLLGVWVYRKLEKGFISNY